MAGFTLHGTSDSIPRVFHSSGTDLSQCSNVGLGSRRRGQEFGSCQTGFRPRSYVSNESDMIRISADKSVLGTDRLDITWHASLKKQVTGFNQGSLLRSPPVVSFCSTL